MVLISIDTLRSDHLPAYGYEAIATPNIDRLAADGVVFENAYSHVPLTLPSHTTIMTGLLPAQTGIRDNAGAKLDSKITTIASELRGRGYATGAAVSAWVLRADTGLANGFESYDDRIPYIEGAPTGNLQRRGAQTVAIAKQWIAANREKPLFAFVHLFEPHAPYEPSYDGEIVTTDALVGELLQSLRENNLYDDALIVLLSDHGEGLMDHGEQEHGVLLYREALQVPLIVKLPRGEKRGTRVATPIGLSQVKSIITDAALPAPDAPKLYAETLYPRIHLGWSDLRSMIVHPFHLIDGPSPELYDLRSDPRETRDVRQSRRREYASLRSELSQVREAFDRDAPGSAIAAEEQKKLAALGYVSAGRSLPASNLNPRDHLGDLTALKRITELMQRREYATAAAEIEALLARNPGWSDLRDQLGVAYESLGDLPRAERAYRDAIAATPELARDFALSLAGVLLAEGKLDDAEAHARLALDTNPPAAHELLGSIALARGDFDAALREANLARSEFLVARIQIARGELPQALQTLNAINQKRQPLPPDFYFVTGEVFERLGKLEEAKIAYETQLRATPGHAAARERLARIGGRVTSPRRGGS